MKTIRELFPLPNTKHSRFMSLCLCMSVCMSGCVSVSLLYVCLSICLSLCCMCVCLTHVCHQKHKLQKSVLLVRSAFQHSMSKSLQQAGFTQWKLVLAIFSLLGAISLIVGILVLLMKSANAFGAVSATVSSGISAIAIAVYNNLGAKKDKDDEGIDKRLQKSIDTINLKLDSFVGLAITDLVFMLRIFPRALDAIKSGIDEAEEKLISDAKDDEDVKAFLAGCIEQAKTAFEKARARCIEQV